ncbi:MAG: hypothetical protein Sapg2KO_33570 [Saprospiraceae bacterium]
MKKYLALYLFLSPFFAFAQKPELVVPLGHSAQVKSINFSPDGKYMVSGSQDGTIKLWTYPQGDLIFTLETGDVVFAVTFRKAQNSIVGIVGKSLMEWDINTKALLRKEVLNMPYTPSIFRGVFSANGENAVLAGYNDKEYWGVDVNTGHFGSFGQRIRSSRWARLAFPVDFKKEEAYFIEESSLGYTFDEEHLFPYTLEPYELTVAEDKNRIGTLTADAFIIWDYQEGRIKSLPFNNREMRLKRFLKIDLSKDGRYLVIGTYEGSLKVWDTLTGQVRERYEAAGDPIGVVKVSPDGQFLIAGGSTGEIYFWDIQKNEKIKKLSVGSAPISELELKSENHKMLISNWEGQVKLFDYAQVRIEKIFSGFRAGFHPDTSLILTAHNSEAILWDQNTGNPIDSFYCMSEAPIRKAIFSNAGDKVLLSLDGALQIFDLKSREEIFSRGTPHEYPGSHYPTKKFKRSELPDSDPEYLEEAFTDFQDQALVLFGDNQFIKMNDLLNQDTSNLVEIIGSEYARSSGLMDLEYNSKSQLFFGLTREGLVTIVNDKFDEVAKIELKNFRGDAIELLSTPFADEFIVSNNFGWFYSFNFKGESNAPYVKAHNGAITTMVLIEDGKYFVTGSMDHTVRFWDWSTKKLIATLYLLENQNWAITDSLGLFDASPQALQTMHYVVNDGGNWEVIALNQLKARYYEPGLLQKLLGFSAERLRPIGQFNSLALYPKIEAEIQNSQLNIQLKARNGGIGKVSIFINGKEVIEEANPLPRRENARRDSMIAYDLLQHKNYFFRHPDSTNIVSIRAYNAEGWLKSQAIELEYKMGGTQSKGQNEEGIEAAWVGQLDPKLYVLTIGTSDYNGTQLDLQYADQDATMMAKALASVGTSLFTSGDSLEVHCLTTATADSTGLENSVIQWQFATRENIASVFKKIKAKAKAEDVVVVYFSGHGVTQSSQDQTQFYYLTQGVASEDDLDDPATLSAYTISSEELTQWINDIPALKQVLIIDACNSGQIVENLTGRTKTMNSSQIRALDRMKDRTGMFVLSGSASNKVSYEASEYGQGLLTYALLQGMLGLATRKDSEGKEVIDVMKLFQYARDEVPRLAASVNGIQTPMLGFPSRAASFDIGILDDLSKDKIVLANKKPVMVKSIFLNKKTFQDDLKLAELLEVALRKESEKGSDADLIYVDVYDYPGAYSVSGLYEVKDETISLQLKLFKDRQDPVDLQIPVEKDPQRLIKRIQRAIEKQLSKN